jgi:hypothetical protein
MSESEIDKLNDFIQGLECKCPSSFVSKLEYFLSSMRNSNRKNGCISSEFYEILQFCEHYAKNNVTCDCDICRQFGD